MVGQYCLWPYTKRILRGTGANGNPKSQENVLSTTGTGQSGQIPRRRAVPPTRVLAGLCRGEVVAHRLYRLAEAIRLRYCGGRLLWATQAQGSASLDPVVFYLYGKNKCSKTRNKITFIIKRTTFF